ncbi:MAG: iron-sulfur cluster repair di-iron protein [Methylococcaceae bacterium]|nr:iron-sulfur cluster repair di-iron protein [Methylococcaceae bacterium]
MKINANTPLKDLALSHSATLRILENHRLDYCCGGGQTLAEACRNAGLDVNAVLIELEQKVQSALETRWDEASLTSLMRFIIDTHHAYTRTQLAHLEALVDKVIKRHGENHPELKEIGIGFSILRDELLPHLLKEENILFPYIEALERHRTQAAPLPDACFGVIDNPIRQMIGEHETVGELLKHLRKLSQDYMLPADGCPSYRAAYQDLEALETDLMRHIHLENNLLFPQARKLAGPV